MNRRVSRCALALVAGLAANGSVARAGSDSCPADLNMDRRVDSTDLALLLGVWGPGMGAQPNARPADLNEDNKVGSYDLAILLGSWGPCPCEIQLVEWFEINNEITANPNAGGGKRVFVDDRSPGDIVIRNTVGVRIQTSPPAGGTQLFLRPFDVDDPSAGGAMNRVDQNDGMAPTGDDNRGRFAAGSLFAPDTPRLTSAGGYDGRLRPESAATTAFAPEGDVIMVTTDAEGYASAVLQLTFQPGDNFRVAVSCNEESIRALKADDGTGAGPEVPSGNDPALAGFDGLLTEMMTVWRKLRIEFDSMAAADNTAPDEDLFGVVTDTSMMAPLGSTALTGTVLTDANETWQPIDQLIGATVDPDTGDADAKAFVALSNTATTVTVRGVDSTGVISVRNVVVLDGETFTLSDGGTDGGAATVRTFEFDLAPGNGVMAGRVAVLIANPHTVAQLQTAIITAVNGQQAGGLDIEAAALNVPPMPPDPAINAVLLRNRTSGAGGNVAIVETVADADFIVLGMEDGDNLRDTGAVGDPYRIDTDDVAPAGDPPNPPNLNAAAVVGLLNDPAMYRKAYIEAMELEAMLDVTEDGVPWDRNYGFLETLINSNTGKDGPTGDGRFWVVSVLGVFEPELEEDDDPENAESVTFGIAPVGGGAVPDFQVGLGVAIVYQESSRDANAANPDLEATAAHEITHCFGCQHATGNTAPGSVDSGDPMGSPANPEPDDDIMTTAFPVPAARLTLNDKHLNEIRTRKAPNATPVTPNPN